MYRSVRSGPVATGRGLSSLVECGCRSWSPSFSAATCVASCRDMSGLVGAGLSLHVVVRIQVRSCGDLSRHVVTCRGRSNLLDVGDVLGDRVRRDQILFAERRFDSAAIEMAFRAIALHASRRTRIARRGHSAPTPRRSSGCIRCRGSSRLVATGRCPCVHRNTQKVPLRSLSTSCRVLRGRTDARSTKKRASITK